MSEMNGTHIGPNYICVFSADISPADVKQYMVRNLFSAVVNFNLSIKFTFYGPKYTTKKKKINVIKLKILITRMLKIKI
jgi:hypothetical protein